MDIQKTKKEFLAEMEKAQNLKALESLRIKYLGRKGVVAGFLGELMNLPKEEIARLGSEINKLKREIEIAIEEKRQLLITSSQFLKEEWFDITAPGKKHAKGHLHQRTIVMKKVENIFQSMGFSVVDGPELETD